MRSGDNSPRNAEGKYKSKMAPARILVVDDELSIRLFLEETLIRDGHQLVLVENGNAALERIKQETFDLVLLDLNLGDMGGMEVLAALHQQSPDTIVIILTAHATLDTAVEALRKGAHDYLFKPCKTVQLRESIRTGMLKRQRELQKRSVLQQVERSLTQGMVNIQATISELTGGPGSPPVALPSDLPTPTTLEAVETKERFYQRGGLIVDYSGHVITVDGHLLELSPTEFNLLAYLISEAPRLVSPQELVREVQGYRSDLWEARDIVRQHIYNLRQKIKDTGRRTELIHTVRGMGYRIE